jgi:hypothetical protein
MGLPESVQVFAFTIAGEWNPENKPGAENPFGLRALRWHTARGSNSATYGMAARTSQESNSWNFLNGAGV